MNAENLQSAYDLDIVDHPNLEKPNLDIPPPIRLVRQLSGENVGIQNNLVFGDLGIVKGFLSYAPNLRNIIHTFIRDISSVDLITDDDINIRFEILRKFLLMNRFDLLCMLEENMSYTAVRHVLQHLSMNLDMDHSRLHRLLTIYSPTRFGYEYEM
jgi:hypothetical protein